MNENYCHFSFGYHGDADAQLIPSRVEPQAVRLFANPNRSNVYFNELAELNSGLHAELLRKYHKKGSSFVDACIQANMQIANRLKPGEYNLESARALFPSLRNASMSGNQFDRLLMEPVLGDAQRCFSIGRTGGAIFSGELFYMLDRLLMDHKIPDIYYVSEGSDDPIENRLVYPQLDRMPARGVALRGEDIIGTLELYIISVRKLAKVQRERNKIMVDQWLKILKDHNKRNIGVNFFARLGQDHDIAVEVFTESIRNQKRVSPTIVTVEYDFNPPANTLHSDVVREVTRQGDGYFLTVDEDYLWRAALSQDLSPRLGLVSQVPNDQTIHAVNSLMEKTTGDDVKRLYIKIAQAAEKGENRYYEFLDQLIKDKQRAV